MAVFVGSCFAFDIQEASQCDLGGWIANDFDEFVSFDLVGLLKFITLGKIDSFGGVQLSQLNSRSSESGLSLDELRRRKIFLLGKVFGKVGERLVADFKGNFSDVELVGGKKFGGLLNPKGPEM